MDRFANSGCSSLRLNGGRVVSLDLGQPGGEHLGGSDDDDGWLTLASSRRRRAAHPRPLLRVVQSGRIFRQGEQFVTPDYATARRKIDLRVASSVGAGRWSGIEAKGARRKALRPSPLLQAQLPADLCEVMPAVPQRMILHPELTGERRVAIQ